MSLREARCTHWTWAGKTRSLANVYHDSCWLKRFEIVVSAKEEILVDRIGRKRFEIK
jgi:hypothetical protein